ncbi:E3 ubiquitin-protein ligase HEL2 KNAG_0B03110 [Huiozyma naganishii CBS 8797]|uniref:RING-type domain-containing protein n=1 Tax=Huiozyma naganishii (strain ATCC MYA-139 / BCRC 22969 / CBS 8797 / KCTC 17520 / NBRC 10181 / NCYC 3082 / Yp74L-3) TaxID=1071383 RepID=J7RGT7_HUIN7|nr:hypothetical protein KNAG_0B03110 [Kazachstania naganishii CBS 8797]CCK68753.1 hypothetical protein KNAG_0B03110 [Kazachstania naganishii CBS 8797]
MSSTQDQGARSVQKPRNRNFRRTQGPQNGDNKRPSSSSTAGRYPQGESAGKSDTEDEDLCLICADKVEFAAVTPCNHRACHKCSFRQLALFKKQICLICRSDVKETVFTEEIHSEYKSFDATKKVIFNEKFGIRFTSERVATATLGLLLYNCRFCKDQEDRQKDYGSFKLYNEHLKSGHNKCICMICATHKHAFPGELKVYTQNQLRNHQSRGDSEGFKGHPMCAFCSGKRFYSDDELYLHMREKHEKCHICDKIEPHSPQYFRDYEQLFDHFKGCHYACTVPSCLDAKFVVFRDELELQAHILKEHGDIIRGKPKFFQSELSTFISAPSRVIRETNDYDIDRSNSLGNRANKETPEMKKSRLEGRAKHYLNNNQDQFRTFLSFNKDYDNNKLRAEDLVNAYKTLFVSPEADVYALIHNLAETYHANSPKYKELNNIYNSHEQQTLKRDLQLPSLSSENFRTVVSGEWGSNVGGGSGKSSASSSRTNLRNLPTLKAPAPNHDPFTSPYQVKKTFSNTRKPVLNNLPSLSTRPTPKPTHPGSSTSSLNSVALNESLRDSQPKGPGTSKPYNSSIKRDKLADLNLPSLPTPKPKVYIPPVHETVLPDPKQWGKTRGEPKAKSEDSDLLANLTIRDNGNSKRKGKQKQLLFHIGM